MKRVSFIPKVDSLGELMGKHIDRYSAVEHGSGWLLVWRGKSPTADLELGKLGAVHLPSMLDPSPIGNEHAQRFQSAIGVQATDTCYAAAKKAAAGLGWTVIDPDID